MLHAQLTLTSLRWNELDVAIRMATMVVAARAESPQLDWEIIVHGLGQAERWSKRGTVITECVVGVSEDASLELAAVTGDAFVVRQVDGVTVLRGEGTLDGFQTSWLQG